MTNDAESQTENVDRSRRLRWLVTLPALVLPFFAAFFYFVLFTGTWFGNAFYVGTKFFLLIWPIVATLWILRESFRRESPEPGARIRSAIHGLGFGLFTLVLMFSLIEWTALGELVKEGTGEMREKSIDLGIYSHFILFSLAISIGHAALEEFYWRWFVYGNLRRLISIPWAHLIAGIGFASHHIVILSQMFDFGFALFMGSFVGFGGMVWSWIYQRHRTMLGPWLSHMMVDLGIFWIAYRLMFSGS